MKVNHRTDSIVTETWTISDRNLSLVVDKLAIRLTCLGTVLYGGVIHHTESGVIRLVTVDGVNAGGVAHVAEEFGDTISGDITRFRDLLRSRDDLPRWLVVIGNSIAIDVSQALRSHPVDAVDMLAKLEDDYRLAIAQAQQAVRDARVAEGESRQRDLRLGAYPDTGAIVHGYLANFEMISIEVVGGKGAQLRFHQHVLFTVDNNGVVSDHTQDCVFSYLDFGRSIGLLVSELAAHQPLPHLFIEALIDYAAQWVATAVDHEISLGHADTDLGLRMTVYCGPVRFVIDRRQGRSFRAAGLAYLGRVIAEGNISSDRTFLEDNIVYEKSVRQIIGFENVSDRLQDFYSAAKDMSNGIDLTVNERKYLRVLLRSSINTVNTLS